MSATDAQTFDADRWLRECLSAADGRVVVPPLLARLAAELAFGRVFVAGSFAPEPGFLAVLVAPDRRTVMGAQARGPFAIVPTVEPGAVMLRPVLWRWMGPDFGSPGWVRVAAFLNAPTAVAGARLLHGAGGLTPTWIGANGLVDLAAAERVLVAGGMQPGRIGPSPLRVYAHRVGTGRR
jgi:hypothetical protein